VTQVLSNCERSKGELQEVHWEVELTQVLQLSSHLRHAVLSALVVNPEGQAATHLPSLSKLLVSISLHDVQLEADPSQVRQLLEHL
jgi:hypothetical protein